MKIVKNLCPAIAFIVICVSCQEKSVGTVESGEKKSVTITIKNVSSTPGTRAAQGDFTPENVTVAAVSELTVLFANGETGAVLETRSLSSGIEEDLTAGKYIFHGVMEGATQLAVTNIAGITNLKDYATTLVDLELEPFQGEFVEGDEAAETVDRLPSVPVWVRSGDFEKTGTDQHGDVTYDLWTAPAVTVVPALARVEIGEIECLDLNSSTKTNGLLPRFGTLEIVNIGIHDTPLDIIGDKATTYTADADGLTAWNAAITAAAWNIDPIAEGDGFVLDGTTATATDKNYDGEVFVYNVVAGEDAPVPNVILEIGEATWNTNGTLTGTPDGNYYVKSTGLGGLGELTPGWIYRVNFKFNSENVKKWEESSELICVDVTVTIPEWQIHEDVLTPDFD